MLSVFPSYRSSICSSTELKHKTLQHLYIVKCVTCDGNTHYVAQARPFSEVEYKWTCGNCSNKRIGDLKTSKAKLRGAKYQREKTKTKLFF